ncbi:hypothetical protein TeGR_g1829 [Tetraparma gracilis]|uniref:Uncharacterized protein n=1 Tax=Tetraparma gracilis TaxID=2962635 RepID=A0ABQ6MNH1_9STRA|nr:hypothetical protein TeGR_g1829 [Tetraparma gracilis]
MSYPPPLQHMQQLNTLKAQSRTLKHQKRSVVESGKVYKKAHTTLRGAINRASTWTKLQTSITAQLEDSTTSYPVKMLYKKQTKPHEMSKRRLTEYLAEIVGIVRDLTEEKIPRAARERAAVARTPNGFALLLAQMDSMEAKADAAIEQAQSGVTDADAVEIVSMALDEYDAGQCRLKEAIAHDVGEALKLATANQQVLAEFKAQNDEIKLRVDKIEVKLAEEVAAVRAEIDGVRTELSKKVDQEDFENRTGDLATRMSQMEIANALRLATKSPKKGVHEN